MINETLASTFTAWESFYVIVGSSAGALTGLQFVVIALISESRQPVTLSQIDAFGTPTVVHFCSALLVSAILSAPWPALSGPRLLLGATGFAGLGYVAVVTIRARRQTLYHVVLEDWIFHTVLPFISYATLVAAAIALRSRTTIALFMIGTLALLLLFVGIHNAWDTITFIAVERRKSEKKSDDGTEV
jgi:hypothetical protein